jgi:hypothetical protein
LQIPLSSPQVPRGRPGESPKKRREDLEEALQNGGPCAAPGLERLKLPSAMRAAAQQVIGGDLAENALRHLALFHRTEHLARDVNVIHRYIDLEGNTALHAMIAKDHAGGISRHASR